MENKQVTVCLATEIAYFAQRYDISQRPSTRHSICALLFNFAGTRLVIKLPHQLYNPGVNQLLNDGIAVKLVEQNRGIDHDLVGAVFRRNAMWTSKVISTKISALKEWNWMNCRRLCRAECMRSCLWRPSVTTSWTTLLDTCAMNRPTRSLFSNWSSLHFAKSNQCSNDAPNVEVVGIISVVSDI